MEIKKEQDDGLLNCVFIEEDYSVHDQFDPLSYVVKKEEVEEVDVKPDLPLWNEDPEDSSSDFKDPPPPDDFSSQEAPSSPENTKETLRQLISNVPKEAPTASKQKHKCPECEKMFPTCIGLKRHLASHEKKRGGEAKPKKTKLCHICEKAFSTNQKLNRHIATHATKTCRLSKRQGRRPIGRTHKCHICGKGFPYPSTLKRHIATHEDDDGDKEKNLKLYQCEGCNRYFSTKLKLDLHEQQQHTGEVLICNICSKTFTKMYNLEAHILRHTTEGKFLCDECGKKFNSEHNLRTHIFRMHNARSREETGVLCNLCGKAFFDRRAYQRHESVHSNERTVPCPQCPMMFKTVQNRKIHMTIHTGEKPHACDICGKAFRRYSWLKTHMSVHGNDRKDCPYCKTCTKSIYLRKHIVTKHRGLPVQPADGPVACTICKSVFETLRLLKDHVEVHANEPSGEQREENQTAPENLAQEVQVEVQQRESNQEEQEEIQLVAL